MTDDAPIPFHRAQVLGNEVAYMAESLEHGHTSASGPFAERAGRLLQEATGGAEVLLTTSCTAALEMSAMLLDLQPGDTVIVPSFSFTSSALAFAREGAQILFCDIEPRTLGPDPASVAALLDDSVRAVVAVHYAGVPFDVEGLRRVLADRPDVWLVEDAAHGLFGSWQGQPLGSLGRVAALSFHETKNVTCGEGGALVLNDPADVDRARILYDKGTDRHAFFLGEVDKYSWRDTGSSFGLADTLAAYLLAQLEQAEAVQARRREVHHRYVGALAPVADELGLQLPVVPPGSEPAWHLFHLLLPDQGTRSRVMARMREHGVATTFHYVPLHSSDGGRTFAARETSCPVSEDVSSRLMRLPLHAGLTDADVDRVLHELLSAVRDG